jgi:uncharacterized protein (TIGR02117 family)
MKNKHLKILLKSLLILPGFILLYFMLAGVLFFFQVNKDYRATEGGVPVYINSNGVHTDIIVPVKNELRNWNDKIPFSDFQKNNGFTHIGFGWGDKGFYLNTPTWADLKFSTAFKAMFWLGSSAMHVSYYEHEPGINEKTKKFIISEEKYKDLISFIDESFDKDASSKYQLIGGHHYSGMNDNFYEAKGKYNLFRTCNCWTNKGLKRAGIRTPVWAPFEWGIMKSLD